MLSILITLDETQANRPMTIQSPLTPLSTARILMGAVAMALSKVQETEARKPLIEGVSGAAAGQIADVASRGRSQKT